MTDDYIIGVDLGSGASFTAIAVGERRDDGRVRIIETFALDDSAPFAVMPWIDRHKLKFVVVPVPREAGR